MKIPVSVKPNAKENKVIKQADGSFLVQVRERPREGRANYAVREALADYFGVSKSRVILSKGEKSKNKIFEIIP